MCPFYNIKEEKCNLIQCQITAVIILKYFILYSKVGKVSISQLTLFIFL